ncbi:ER membrane protein complex subunit 6 isoform X1 [Neodiprion virginianus]|uniref:ER membrane protein complex subunit 6 n=1 Tax=Neodiprion lecontei TaxID=441921 RepID=A0ABM3G6R5_NEOLC|nr:ER membrane protein complex subunit 6 isoform X1 [Neodiprion fabricii]XP_046595967.1 ER membrane protein complex subunit 6 isoform X1 [Neodiprion lecontei]XP_046622693.1 ER membrane protein complex subunit 6 isoform X1 [Neodiprion virginianus]
MSTKVRTKQEKTGEVVAYSEGAVRNNSAVVEYCRISMAALSGSTAGLLGLTGLYGFGFYIFAVVGLWALLMMKTGGQWKKYFISRQSLLTNGFFGGLFIPFRHGACLLRGGNTQYLKLAEIHNCATNCNYYL